MEEKAFMVPNPQTPCRAIHIDPDLCTGCNACIEVCRTDVMVPNPEKGEIRKLIKRLKGELDKL